MPAPAAVYRPRNPQDSDYYRCVEDNFETFVQIYDEYFSRQYGFWRPYVEQVIYRYLDCGNLHNGFARVKCKDCGHEYLLAFSCKRRHFCPSCHQKRVVEFGEWLCMNVLKKIPHRHFVFRRRHELTIAKYVLEKWCNSILHGMNHAVFGYRPFLYQTL